MCAWSRSKSRRTSRHKMSRENPRARQLAKSIRAPHLTVNIALATKTVSAVHRADLFAPFFSAFAKAFFAAAFTALLATSFATACSTWFTFVFPVEVFLGATTVFFLAETFADTFAAFLAAPFLVTPFFAAAAFTGAFSAFFFPRPAPAGAV